MPAGDTGPLPVLGSHLHEKGEDRGGHPVPGHEVRKPDAAEGGQDSVGQRARDLPADTSVYQHRAEAPAFEGSSRGGQGWPGLAVANQSEA